MKSRHIDKPRVFLGKRVFHAASEVQSITWPLCQSAQKEVARWSADALRLTHEHSTLSRVQSLTISQELVERACLEVAMARWGQWAPWDQDTVTLRSDFGVEMADFRCSHVVRLAHKHSTLSRVQSLSTLQEPIERACLEVAVARWDQRAPWDQDTGSV